MAKRRNKDQENANRSINVQKNTGSLKKVNIEEPKKTNPNIIQTKKKQPQKSGGGTHLFDKPTPEKPKGGSHGFSKDETPVKQQPAFGDIVSTSGNKKDPTKHKPMETRRLNEVATQKKKADYESDKQLADKWFREMYDLETHDIGNTGYQVKLGKAFAQDKDRRDELMRSAAIETGRTHKEIEDLYKTYKLRRGAENMADLADNGNVGGKALASAASLGTNLLSAVGSVPALTKNFIDDEYANTDSFGHIMGEATDRAREEVANDITNPVGKTAYNTGMGFADFGVDAAIASILPGTAARYVVPTLQALDASEDYSRLALDNGVSGRKAALTGATAGALDYAFNRFGLENILKQGAAQTGKQVAKNIAKGALAEGGNNALQQALSLGADYGFNREQSQLGNIYQTALDNGLTEEQARNEAMKYLLRTSGQSGAAGALFGGAFAGMRGRGDLRQARLDEQARTQLGQNQVDSMLDLIESNTDEPNRVPSIRRDNSLADLSYGELMDTATSSRFNIDDAKALARQIRDLDNNLSNMTDLSDIQDYMSARADMVSRLNDLGYNFDDQGRLWDTEEVQRARQTADERARAQAEADEQDMYLQQLLGEPMFENQVPNLRPTGEAPSYDDIMSDVNMMPSRYEIAQDGLNRVRSLVNNATPEDALSGRLEEQINTINNDLEQLGYRLNKNLELEEIPNEKVNSLLEKYNNTTSDRTRNSLRKQIEDEGYAVITDESGTRVERIDDIVPTVFRNPFESAGVSEEVTPANVNTPQTGEAKEYLNEGMNIYRVPDNIKEIVANNRMSVHEMTSVATAKSGLFIGGEGRLPEKVSKYWGKWGNKVHNEILGDVTLSKKGVKDSIFHNALTRRKADTFAVVPDVIEKGVIIDYQPSWKGRDYDTAMIVAPTTLINDSGVPEEYITGVIVRRNKDMQKFYTHDAVSVKQNEPSLETRETSLDTPTEGESSSSIYNILHKIADDKANFDRTSSQNSITPIDNSVKGVNPIDLGVQPIDYNETPATRPQTTSSPVNNVPHMDGTMYGDGQITTDAVNTRPLVNNEINGTDISQRYKTLKNSDLFRKSQSNMAMLEKSKDEGVFNKTVEGRKQAQEDALNDYVANREQAAERNLTRQWDSGKDLDTAMLILNDALAEGNQAKTNLILLKQAQQLKGAGRELRAARDYAGTLEGTLSKAAQYLDDQADSVLNSGRKVRDRIESMAESIKRDPESVMNMDIDDAAKTMLRDAINAGADKEDITRMLAMYEKIGKMGISKEAYLKLDDIDKRMKGLGLKSKARAELELDFYKVLADDIGGTRSLRDKWDAWRYLAMLGNPKTHVRNMLGNATHYMVTEAKDNLAAVIEGMVVGNRGERTKAVLAPSDRGFVKAALKDADNVYTDLTEGGNKYNVKSEIDKARKAFGTKGMNAVNDFNTNALEWEDYFALKHKYSKSLARYLKANGADESIFHATDDASKALLEKGRAYAIDQAKQATFHEFSEMADSLSRFSNKMRNGTTAQKIGGAVIEGILPFKKTPINILKQAVKYSPVSLAKALKKGFGAVKTGKFTASEVIDDLASGLTGSGIVALGAFLSSQGFLTGKANDDYDVDNAESEQGIQNYALKIGNKSYTLDWLAPFALPLFVGVDLYNSYINDGDDDVEAFDKVINSMTTIAEPVTEMSMLQGLNNVINEVAYSKENALATIVANSTLGYFTQGVPTLAGQIARSVDPYRRSTYSDEDGTFSRQVDKTVSKTLNKVPFLNPVVNAITGDSYGEPYIDYKGNPQESQGLVSTNVGSNVFTRAVDQMLSPGYYREGNLTEVDKELNRLYEATGLQVYPEVYTGKVDNRRLSKAEHTKYQTLFGQTTNELYEKAISSPEYANLDDDQKADVITKLRTLAKDIADHDIGGKTLSDSKQKDYDLYKSGGADAVIEKRLIGKILTDAGATNTEKNREQYKEQGQAFIDQKSAAKELKDTYGISGANVTYALDKGVSPEDLQMLKDMEVYPGRKVDFKEYADAYTAVPELSATPYDYMKLYGDVNSYDPKTKGVSQTDLINYVNATGTPYAEAIFSVWWDADAKNQPVKQADGTWKKVKVK